MKKVIRRNVFETNSSSSHSIIITKNDTHVTAKELNPRTGDGYYDYTPESIYISKNGEWYLHETNEGFGRWPLQFLTTFEDKFKYALCEYLGYEDPVSDRFKDEWDVMVSIAKDACPDIKGIDVDDRYVDIFRTKSGKEISDLHNWIITLNEDTDDEKYIWKSYSLPDGEEEVEYIDERKVPVIGVIDHQSAGLLSNFLNGHKITLKEFLTNKKYIIVVNGDEYDDKDALFSSGLINTDFIVEEYDRSTENIMHTEWLKEQKENEESKAK